MLEGRIALRDGEKRYHANISWRHDILHDEILISTPLGQGIAELRRDPDGVRMVDAQRREVAAADWDALSAAVFDIRLPLSGLPRWLSGRAPDAASGWRAEYLDYASAAPDALPTLVEFRRGDIEVRIRIDEWTEAF